MRILNLGILAHVDAGKTTLTERLLYAAGVIDEIGSVDDGSTQTDSLALERQRGITIKAAVVSFVIEGAHVEGGAVTVNLIDTPGHPDFIAEVERALGVLDGAVLVVSAVEGVQSQTRVLMRTLQRLRIPTLIFVNKIDRSGARYEGVLAEIAAKLTPAVVAMGSAADLGTRDASFAVFGADDAEFTSRMTELFAERDDAFMATYVSDETAVPYCRLREELAAQTGRSVVHPVFFGSAITGAGVDALMGGIAELLPATEGDADGPVSGVVFKVERGGAGEKVAYVRMFSGTVRVRDQLESGAEGKRKVTAIRVFERGAAVERRSVSAGEIAKVWGLGDIQIGDAIGVPRDVADRGYFAPPTLESIVVPRRMSDSGALHTALSRLAEQDPLINVRQNDVRRELSVSLYGEVQKEVIGATLADEFGLDVEFRETTTICIERPSGTGEAGEVLYAKTKTNVTGNCSPFSSNPFLATVGLRIEPAPVGSGIEFRLDVDVRVVPIYIYKTVDAFVDHMGQYVRETLREGIYGWEVTDCIVTMIDSGYRAPGSTAADFRKLTPLVLMSALQQAGTVVYEPMHRFRLEIPADAFGATVPVLGRLRAVPQTQQAHAAFYVLEGYVPAAHVHELQKALPALTRGEGVLESAFERYQPTDSAPPSRPRTDHNPLDRKEYLLHVLRRV